MKAEDSKVSVSVPVSSHLCPEPHRCENRLAANTVGAAQQTCGGAAAFWYYCPEPHQNLVMAEIF
jgi:hypothetical protein